MEMTTDVQAVAKLHIECAWNKWENINAFEHERSDD